jgi:hypothetical protein
MNELQKELLIGYLRDGEIDILSINFLKGGNISSDSLTVHYYKKQKHEWFLTTDIVTPTGEVQTRSVKALR